MLTQTFSQRPRLRVSSGHKSIVKPPVFFRCVLISLSLNKKGSALWSLSSLRTPPKRATFHWFQTFQEQCQVLGNSGDRSEKIIAHVCEALAIVRAQSRAGLGVLLQLAVPPMHPPALLTLRLCLLPAHPEHKPQVRRTSPYPSLRHKLTAPLPPSPWRGKNNILGRVSHCGSQPWRGCECSISFVSSGNFPRVCKELGAAPAVGSRWLPVPLRHPAPPALTDHQNHICRCGNRGSGATCQVQTPALLLASQVTWNELLHLSGSLFHPI